MVVLRHEIKSGRNALIIWTAAIAFLLAVCILIYPEMAGQMSEISDTFAQLGGFSAAFGMDEINFGEFTGFFGVECGNVLGLGGAFFAALIGISALAKEEKEHTAEFLLTHPLGRIRIVAEKLGAVVIQVIILNAVVAAVTAVCILAIGEKTDVGDIALMLFAYLLLQVEIAFICFGISAFLRRSGLGIGLGLAAIMYFLNIIANLVEQAEFLKYITPFGYTESSAIIADGGLNGGYVALGAVLSFIGIAAAFSEYQRKDIA